MNEKHLSNQGYLRLKNVLELVPVSRSTWYLWVQRGIAPKPIKVSLRVAAWKVQDIKKLLEDIEKPEWVDLVKQKSHG